MVINSQLDECNGGWVQPLRFRFVRAVLEVVVVAKQQDARLYVLAVQSNFLQENKTKRKK